MEEEGFLTKLRVAEGLQPYLQPPKVLSTVPQIRTSSIKVQAEPGEMLLSVPLWA